MLWARNAYDSLICGLVWIIVEWMHLYLTKPPHKLQAAVKEEIESLGGVFVPRFSPQTQILVAARVNSEKYQVRKEGAEKLGEKVLRPF